MALNDPFFTVASSIGLQAPKILSAATGTTAGGTYMAKLGGYMFSIDTAAFQQLQRNTEYRWTLLNRIGRAPAAQFLGRGEDTIEVQGTIYPHFRGGIGQLGLMRAAADAGEPLPLVYAFETVGQYAGLWCIKSLKEGRTVFFRDGVPRKIEFTMSLVAYGEDAVAGGMPAAVSLAAGTVSGLLGGGLKLPAILGNGITGPLASAATAVKAMTPVTLTSALADIKAAAGVVSSVSQGVANIAALVKSQNPLAALGALAPAVRQFVGPEGMAAAKAVVDTSVAVLGAHQQIARAASVLGAGGKTAALRDLAGALSNQMQQVERAAATTESNAKRIQESVSRMPAADALANVARTTAAGAMANVARLAAGLGFGAREGAAQASAMQEKIDG